MLKSYLPARYNSRFLILTFLILIFANYIYAGFVVLFYVGLYILFRKNRNDFRDGAGTSKGVVFSPCHGKVIAIKDLVDQVELILRIPVWKEMGIFLPFSCEVKDLTVEKKGINLFLETQGDVIQFSLRKTLGSLWPEILIMPGDRGGRRVNIGFFPFGGLLILSLPKKYEILVNVGDDVAAGESLIAVNSGDEQLN